MKARHKSSFEKKYPAIVRWVREFGRVEIGYEAQTDTFIRALEEGGMWWGGQGEYGDIDEALGEMERGISALLKENRPDQVPSRDRRTADRPRKTARATDKNRSETAKTPSKRPERRTRPEETPAIRKVRKLSKIPEALRQHEHCSVTRLTVLKGLCEDSEAAGAFALFLARKIQQRMREKGSPKRYRQLVNRAVREMKPYLDDPTEEQNQRLWSLLREIEAEQNEYENIPWGMVRNVKSFDLLAVEHALRSVLRPYEAPFWLYQAARDYTGKTSELPPSAAPIVEEIARFWRKRLKVKP